jgi:hypothetical protein
MISGVAKSFVKHRQANCISAVGGCPDPMNVERNVE